MKILIINDTYGQLGGTERYLYLLVQALSQRGYSVVVLSIEPVGINFLQVKENILFVEELKFKHWTKKLENLLLQINPDIIYLHNFSNNVLIEKLLRFKPVCKYIHDPRFLCIGWSKVIKFNNSICPYSTGFWCIPCAFYSHTISYRPKLMFNQVKNKIQEIKINRRIPKIIVASNYIKELLLANKFSSKQIIINPYYVNIPPEENWEYSNFILFVGRIWEQKGLQYLLNALKYCHRELLLKVIGDGPFLSTIKNQIEKLKLNNRVELLGELPHDKISEYYKKCLCLVVPSIWPEPFGIVGLEAMSFARPVIAFDVGGINEWLVHEETGFLVRRGDIKGISEKITLLLKDKSICLKMGSKGRLVVQRHFNEDNHINSLEKVFWELKEKYCIS